MPANKAPIFPETPQVSFDSAVTAANTAKDAASGTVYTVFTADATDGSFLQKLRVRPKGTNVVTVMRIFINNGGATTTAANNSLYDELPLPATTNSEVAALPGYEVPFNMMLPATYRILVTLGTSVAGGYAVTAVGGAY